MATGQPCALHGSLGWHTWGSGQDLVRAHRLDSVAGQPRACSHGVGVRVGGARSQLEVGPATSGAPGVTVELRGVGVGGRGEDTR